ncbi:hypothetical protein [Pseudomonas sp. IPO3774]|uniref:hypothetical protein n=1 Tax=Pseudomonas sp. IPO3774 TaxID=2738826 RepID=UPI0015A1E680|nr:hypothetical protein [Pseudomonas sp. IPO3774]NWD63838.1 hypothetical protein [Pseudomonas sp. IPO3774]
MSASMFFGVLGIILAAVEIWRPRLSAALEVTIIVQIEEVKAIQTQYFKDLETISKLALGAFKEVENGPQFVTPEEFKANTVTSLLNIRSYLWFYCVTAVNFLILRPLHTALITLNRLGRGRAVGGLGLVIAVLSTFL